MKKVLTISERGELAQQLVHKDHFYTDMTLYNQHFPGSKLAVQLSKANEHNITGLHNKMLYELLSKADHEDILLNRETPEEKAIRLQAEADEIKAAQEKLLERVKETIIVLLNAGESTDDEILSNILSSTPSVEPITAEELTTFVNDTISEWKEANKKVVETPEERAARLQAIYVETFIIIDGERRTVLDDDNQLTTVIFTPTEDGAHFGKATDVDGKPAPAFVYEQNGKAYLVIGEDGDYTEVTGEPIAKVTEDVVELPAVETPVVDETSVVESPAVETPVVDETPVVKSPSVETKSTTEKKVVDKKKGKKPTNSRK